VVEWENYRSIHKAIFQARMNTNAPLARSRVDNSQGQPRMIVFAGPNGSGKSTFAHSLKKCSDFPELWINGDEIAKRLEKKYRIL
jgi:adenylylsulfate kinase-like enzyme